MTIWHQMASLWIDHLLNLIVYGALLLWWLRTCILQKPMLAHLFILFLRRWPWIWMWVVGIGTRPAQCIRSVRVNWSQVSVGGRLGATMWVGPATVAVLLPIDWVLRRDQRHDSTCSRLVQSLCYSFDWSCVNFLKLADRLHFRFESLSFLLKFHEMGPVDFCFLKQLDLLLHCLQWLKAASLSNQVVGVCVVLE